MSIEPKPDICHCEICLKETEVSRYERYGDWKCRHCGQKYAYDEGHHIVLTERQIELLSERTPLSRSQLHKLWHRHQRNGKSDYISFARDVERAQGIGVEGEKA